VPRNYLPAAVSFQPNFVAARSVLGSVLVQKGLYEEALAEYEKVLELTKGVAIVEASVKAIMGHAYAKWGKRSEALKLLDEITMAGPASSYSIAGIHAALGDCDSAFEWLHKSFEQHEVQLVSMKVDPTLDGALSDSRFAELVRRVGLP